MKILIEKLKKRFGKLEVLKGIDLEFASQGKISAILGPNGSGKTTLIKCMLGMVLPDSGEIRINGSLINGQHAYRDGIGYLPQIARFPENLTVQELMQLIQRIRGRHAVPGPLLERFGLQPFLHKRMGTLSGGTRQKVNLVLAFMYDSPVLILDEPSSGLDPVAMIQLKDLIRQERVRGKMILITTHIISLVEELADEIVFLLEGTPCFRGAPAQLKECWQTEDLEYAIAALLGGGEGSTKSQYHPQPAQ